MRPARRGWLVVIRPAGFYHRTPTGHNAATFEDALDRVHDGPFIIEWVTKLSLALARLHAQQRTPIDAILVDLTLPDSQGLATFNRLFVQASGISIMTLSELALLFIDLDNVKDINDSLDHNIGDQLLQAVALRLCSCLRSADTLSPSGGDEFVVLLEQNHSEEDATRTAEKIREALASTVEIAQQTLHISASIGIST